MASDILVVDDEQDIREIVSGILSDEGHELAAISDRVPRLVFLDVWMQGSRLDGLGLLDEIKSRYPDLPVVMISGHGNIEMAVNAIRRGAYDFIEKPFKADRLILIAERALETSKLKREVRDLKKRSGDTVELIGTSVAVSQLRQTIDKVAPTNSRGMILGPSGSGKELVAQAIHAASPRKAGPLVAVNCGAIAESLFESEMFGYEEGAFTGSRRGGRRGLVEAADGGSLFLDEIGEMPAALQTRLLRVLEERQVMRVGASSAVPVDIRVIAATHCDLGELVAQGRFRQDLYFRINVLRLRVPDLAERSEDIEELLQAMLQRQFNAPVQVRAEALALLRRYPWPGNVRELRNIVERLPLALAGTSPYVVDRQVLAECAPELLARAGVKAPAPRADVVEATSRPDRRALLAALARAKGNRAAVAAQFGVSRTTLWRWLRES